MTTPITGTGAAATTATTSTTGGSTMDGDAFLKLLVAQLKYQDPTKPVDTTQFMAQTAQLQMVETLQKLSDQNSAILSGQNAQSALTLVGQTVTYSLDGVTATGTVEAVRLTGAGPVLVVGDKEIPLYAVSQVGTTKPADTKPADTTPKTTDPASTGTA